MVDQKYPQSFVELKKAREKRPETAPEPMPGSVESGPQTEPQIEQEKRRETIEPELKARTAVTPAQSQGVIALGPMPTVKKSERLVMIERILSRGLESIYHRLEPAQQQIMKQEGERAAGAIEKLIETGKATAKKILETIQLWFSKIPGVNRYFLEQESKIKTDDILKSIQK